MPSRTLPNMALKAFYDIGEGGWGDEVSENFLKLSILAQAGAIDLVSATPGSPANGDVYLFDETHPTQPNAVAVYDVATWKYFTPFEGWLIYNRTDNLFQLFDGVSWTDVVFGSGLSDAPSDGSLYARRDGAWEAFTAGGGGSSDWSTLFSWDHAVSGNLAQPTIDDITANEILVIFHGVILSTAPPAAGTIPPAILVSTNNGVSFVEASNSYVAVNVNNLETGDTYLRGSTSGSASARTSFIRICNAQQSGAPKFADTNGEEVIMPTVLDPINAIRVQGRSTPAVTFIAGKIWVLGR